MTSRYTGKKTLAVMNATGWPLVRARWFVRRNWRAAHKYASEQGITKYEAIAELAKAHQEVCAA